MHRFSNSLIYALALSLVAAMPMHFVFNHEHELLHQSGHGDVLHLHESDCAPQCDAGGCDDEAPANPEFHDASGCGEPHQHGSHAHGISDQGYLSQRTASVFYAALMPPPVRGAFAVVVNMTPAAAIGPPLYQTPSLDFPTLRGPPLS